MDQLLLEAVNRRASDVHLEAFDNEIRVRYRIDGRCYQIAQPPATLALALASRIKVMANLDVADIIIRQAPQLLDELLRRPPALGGLNPTSKVLLGHQLRSYPEATR